jgi:hypothetical protein
MLSSHTRENLQYGVTGAAGLQSKNEEYRQSIRKT